MAEDDVIRDDEDLEETLFERLLGLTEMFPENIRNATGKLVGGTSSAVSFICGKGRSALWLLSSSFVVMLLPYVFEKERADYEEKIRQEERNITNEDEIELKIKEGEARLAIGLHYKNPYPRPVYAPPGTMAAIDERKKKVYREKLHKEGKPIYIDSIRDE